MTEKKKKDVKEVIVEIPLEEVEVVSQKVEENIKTGETSLEVFSPLKAEVNKVVEFLSGVEIKTPEEMTEEDLKQYKKFRTGVNKVLGFVEDRRKDITSKLMELKDGFMDEEKKIVKELSEKGIELKNLIDEKVELDKKAERKELLPIRKKKLTLINIELSDEELLEMDEKAFSIFYNQKMEEKLEEDARKKAEDDRIKEAEEKAREKALKEAEEKAEKEKKKAVEEAKKEVRDEIREETEEIREEEKSSVGVVKQEPEAVKGNSEENKGNVKTELDPKLKEFLRENKFNKEVDILKQTPTEYRLYRVVKVLKK